MKNAKAHGTKQHYVAHTSSSYESAFFYSVGDYTSHLRDVVLSALRIKTPQSVKVVEKSAPTWSSIQSNQPNNFLPSSLNDEHRDRIRIMDIGGGTGNFTKMMIECSPSNVDGIVIDPFLTSSESEQNPIISVDKGSNQICFVKAGAEDFISNISSTNEMTNESWWKQSHHQCLMKEVVHHFDSKDRLPIFQGISESLLPIASLSPTQISSFSSISSPSSLPPSVLIITRPQVDIDYPLWPEAKQVWKENQPSEKEIMQDLETAGFTQVSCEMKINECNIALDTWCNMIKSRFWSTFSKFSDHELEEACISLKSRYEKSSQSQENLNISFEDRLLFISGCKEGTE